MSRSNITRLLRYRPATAIRALLLVTAVAGSLVAAWVVFGVSGWVAATPATAQTVALPGTASLSGTVASTAPFKAAQVSLRNVDKRILYMVYTNAGQFRAVSLFPGNYEVSVATKGFESDVQKVVLKAGDNPKLNLSLRSSAGASARTLINALETEASTNTLVREEQSYDEVYPPGPGRDVAERTCMVCHGENFLPSRPGGVAAWNTRIDFMQGRRSSPPAGAYAEGLLTFRHRRCVSRGRIVRSCWRIWLKLWK